MELAFLTATTGRISTAGAKLAELHHHSVYVCVSTFLLLLLLLPLSTPMNAEQM